MKGNNESVIGIIVKGSKKKLNELISSLERDQNIRLVYIRRPSREDSYLLIIETTKVRSGA